MIGAFFARLSSDHREGMWYVIPALFALFLALSDLFFVAYYLKESLSLKHRATTLAKGLSGAMSYINPVDLFQFNGVLNLNRQGITSNGYVKPYLVTHVPGWPALPSIGGQTPSHSSVTGINNNGQSGPGGSYPATPQTVFPPHSPPDPSTRDTPSVASSYAPGLGQSGVGQPGSEMDYMEMMSNNELSSIDDNLNLDNLNNFGFDFMQYNQSTKLQ